MNRMSTNIATVCEVKKSRSVSYWVMRLMKAPVDVGRAERLVLTTRSNSDVDSLKSMPRPA